MAIAGRTSKSHKFRVVLDQPSELAYWSKTLQASEAEIRAAMKAVGDNALRVREFLDGERARTAH